MTLKAGSVWITWNKLTGEVSVEMVPSMEKEESFTLFEFLSGLGITALQAKAAYEKEDYE